MPKYLQTRLSSSTTKVNWQGRKWSIGPHLQKIQVKYKNPYFPGNLFMVFLAFVKPYVFSVLPSGSVPTNSSKDNVGNSQSAPTFIQSSVVQIRSSLSLLPVQTLPFPFPNRSSSSTPVSDQPPPPANSTIRLLTPSPDAKSPLFLITTPTDRANATAEGSSIWQFRMKPWGEQVDELVRDGLYSDALSLLETIDNAWLPDKVRGISLC